MRLVVVAFLLMACGPVVKKHAGMLHGEGACVEKFGDPYFRVCFKEEERLSVAVEITSASLGAADPTTWELSVNTGGETLVRETLAGPTTRKGSCKGRAESLQCQSRTFTGRARVAIAERTSWPTGRYEVLLTRANGVTARLLFEVRD